MKENKKIRLVFLALLNIVFFSGCESVMNVLFTNQPQLISEAVEISSEWKEIVPPAPLKSKTSIQYVSLKMPESVWKNADWDESDPSRKTLKYGDGRRGKIEAFLYDDKGESYELQINGKGNGFDLGRKAPPRNPDQPPANEPDFPTDRTFTKLRIRSDVPLKLDKIEWAGYNPK